MFSLKQPGWQAGCIWNQLMKAANWSDVFCTSSQGKEAGLWVSGNYDGAGFTAIIKSDQNVAKWSHISAVDIPKGGAPVNQRIA